ncbi:ABC transporter substrate-binding protein [Spirochaetia bacterium]|nr:ABC transporter substrate-binding protein [Spirochaetia bacterium]
MKRKVFSVFLVIAMAAILMTGCEKKTPAATASAGGGLEGDITLSMMWLGSTVQTRVLREYAEEVWPQKFPNIKLVFTEVSNTEINNKVAIEGATQESGYDVVIQNNLVAPLVNLNALYSIDDFIKRDNYDMSKLMNNGLDTGGKYYAVPIRGDVRTLHYNQELFRLAGLDPDKPPTNRAEMEAYAEKLKAVLPAGKYAINTNLTNNDPILAVLYQMGADIIDTKTGACALNSPQAVAAIQLLCDWYKKGYFDPRSISWQYSDEVAAYLSGNAAIYDGWPARYIDARDPRKSTVLENSRVAAAWGEKILISGWSMAIWSKTKHADAAWEFLKFCVDPVTQKAVIDRGGDCNPTHFDVLGDPELNAKYEVLKAVRDVFPKIERLPQTSQLLYIRNLLTEYIPQAVSGKMTAKQAMDALVEEANEALRDAGELK